MGKGERGGGGEMKAGVGGEVNVQKYTSAIQFCSGEIFFRAKHFLLMTIADSPLLGQSASGLQFDDDSGRSLLASSKPFILPFYSPLAD
jgi:hypothetical protein